MASRLSLSLSVSIFLVVLGLCGVTGAARAQKPQAEGTSAFTIKNMTMAVTRVDSMVRFYEHVFATRLTAFDAYGTTLYSGKLLGFSVLFCPNSVAGVVAQQNRHQFDIETDDLPGVMRRVREAGGSLRDDSDPKSDAGVVTVTDPDGNTMVFFGKK